MFLIAGGPSFCFDSGTLARGWCLPLRASDDGVEGVTRHVIAYAIILAALALVLVWRVWSERARHRHRMRDDRIDLFHEDG
jgi:hypothetical protein